MYSFRQTIDIVGMVVYVFETPCKLPTLQYRGHFEGTPFPLLTCLRTYLSTAVRTIFQP